MVRKMKAKRQDEFGVSPVKLAGPFEPRPYQKAVFDNIVKKGIPLPSQRFGRHPYRVGIDMGEPGGDKTVVAYAQQGKNGIVKIWFDEFADWADYKWYRHPIKWWKVRRLMRSLKIGEK